jgi:hypothetical protein
MGSGRLDTRLDTPPISFRHHPLSRLNVGVLPTGIAIQWSGSTMGLGDVVNPRRREGEADQAVRIAPTRGKGTKAWRHHHWSRCSPIRVDGVGFHVKRTLDGAAQLAGIIGSGILIGDPIGGLTQ